MSSISYRKKSMIKLDVYGAEAGNLIDMRHFYGCAVDVF